MAETNFENAELNLVIIDKAGVATTAFLRQSVSDVVSGPSSVIDGDIAVFDGTTGKVIGASGVKLFEALISQSADSDPTISVFRSMLDFTVVSARTDIGIYSLGIGSYAIIEYVMIEIGCGRKFTEFDGPEWVPSLITIRRESSNPFDNFFIQTYVFRAGAFTLSDDVLFETPLRITAYPH